MVGPTEPKEGDERLDQASETEGSTPTPAENSFCQGVDFLKKKKYALAAEKFQAAIFLNEGGMANSHHLAYWGWALYLLGKARASKAIEDVGYILIDYVARKDGGPAAHYFMGMIHFLTNDLAPAEKSFERALVVAKRLNAKYNEAEKMLARIKEIHDHQRMEISNLRKELSGD